MRRRRAAFHVSRWWFVVTRALTKKHLTAGLHGERLGCNLCIGTESGPNSGEIFRVGGNSIHRILVSANFTVRTLRVSNIILVYECR